MIEKFINLISNMIEKNNRELHTFALGKIESFDTVNMRATVYLLENIQYENKYYPSNTIVDCLVQFPKTDSFYIRFPYKKGDKVAVAFCESNIADIMLTGDRTNQTLTRRHSEDDLVIIGGWISENNDMRCASENTNDIIIVNTKHNSKIVFTEDNNINITGIDNINIQCNNANVNAQTTTITSPTTTINGETTINGNTSIKGMLDVSQKVSTPTVSASNSLSIAGTEMKGHTHTVSKPEHIAGTEISSVPNGGRE